VLGLLYLSQKITDYAQAYFWFSLAAKGYPPGQERNNAAAARDAAADRLKPGQLKDMQKLARGWQPTTGP
jgi:TPR repeat protein